jgi:uncharacterized protein (TIGR02246 family)
MDTRTRVLSTIETMTRAFNQGDLEGVLRTYEPLAVVVGQPGVPVQGEAHLRAMFADFIAAKAHFDFGGHEVTVAGDLAVHLTSWKMSGVAPDGSPLAGAGLSIAVLRRQPDDTWLMVIDNPFGDQVLHANGPTHEEIFR